MTHHYKFLIGIACVGILNPGFALAEPFDSAAQDGVSHYNSQEYDQALNKFQEAQVNQPQNPEVAYNLGNARYQLGQFESAIEDYNNVIAKSPDTHLKKQALYNQGNAYYRLGYLREAIQSYKKALEIDPNDEDSKFNLEYTQKQLEKALKSGQMTPKKDQGKQESNKPQPTPNPSEEENQTAEQTQKESGEKQELESSPKENQPDEKKEDAEQFAQNQPPAAQEPKQESSEDQKMKNLLHEMAPMSREEAERWLNSLNEDIRKYKKRQMQGKMQDLFNEQQKDW